MNVDLATIIFGWNKTLGTADHLLTRAEEHARSNGIAEAEMLEWRLAPDMFPLRQQFQIVCNLVQQWSARPADVEVPPEPKGDMDVAELRAMIAAARAFVSSISPDRLKGRDDVPVTVNLGVIEPTMPIGQWVTSFATTNIVFHLSIAYAILRSKGVPIGKRDLFGGGL
jgi:hypothetical protein